MVLHRSSSASWGASHGDEHARSLATGHCLTPGTSSGWDQVILREQEAIRGHRLPIVHAYSHNDLTALQKYPTGFPVGQTDSPGSSGENSHSR